MPWGLLVRNITILSLLGLILALYINVSSSADANINVSSSLDANIYSETEKSLRSIKRVAVSDTNIVSAVTFEKIVDEKTTLYTAHIYENDDYIGPVISTRLYDSSPPQNLDNKFHFLLRNNAIVVQFKEGLSQKRLNNFLSDRKWRIVQSLPSNNAIIIKVKAPVNSLQLPSDTKPGYELEAVFDMYAIALEMKANSIQSYEEVEFATPELEISETALKNIYFDKPVEAGTLLPLINAWQSTELKTRARIHGESVWSNALSFNDTGSMPQHELGFANGIEWKNQAEPINVNLSASLIEAKLVGLAQEMKNLEAKKRSLTQDKIP